MCVTGSPIGPNAIALQAVSDFSVGQDPSTLEVLLRFVDSEGREAEVRLPPEMLEPLGFGVDALRLAREETR